MELSGPINALKELGHLSLFTPKQVELWAPTNHSSSGAHLVEIEKKYLPKTTPKRLDLRLFDIFDAFWQKFQTYSPTSTTQEVPMWP